MNESSQNSKGLAGKKKSGAKRTPEKTLERERFRHELLLKLSILKKARA